MPPGGRLNVHFFYHLANLGIAPLGGRLNLLFCHFAGGGTSAARRLNVHYVAILRMVGTSAARRLNEHFFAILRMVVTGTMGGR